MPHTFEAQILISGQAQNTTRCPDNYVRTFILQNIFMGFDVDTTIENRHLYVGKVGAESLELVANLDGHAMRVR